MTALISQQLPQSCSGPRTIVTSAAKLSRASTAPITPPKNSRHIPGLQFQAQVRVSVFVARQRFSTFQQSIESRLSLPSTLSTHIPRLQWLVSLPTLLLADKSAATTYVLPEKKVARRVRFGMPISNVVKKHSLPWAGWLPSSAVPTTLLLAPRSPPLPPLLPRSTLPALTRPTSSSA